MTQEEKARAYDEALEKARKLYNDAKANEYKSDMEDYEFIFPELAESEDERIMSRIIDGFKNFSRSASKWNNIPIEEVIVYLEKQKENPKSADSIPSDCTSDAKYEDRWHKVTDSLPDNGRLVLAKDCLGNVLLARYDGENWEVNVYDNEDHYCHNSISKWCEIPSEKQKEQKPAEWSEEDEKDMAHIIRILDDCYVYGTHDLSKTDRENLVNKLKSLRPQYHGDVTMTEAYKMGLEAGKASSWKPSEEDLMMLEHIIGQYEIGNKNSKVMGYLPRIEELDFLKKVLAKWKNGINSSLMAKNTSLKKSY